MPNFSPRFPLNLSNEGSYEYNTTIKQVIRQNLKNLLLTAPGERIMDPEFGVGVRNYLFEANNQTTASRLEISVNSQVKKYMPFIEVQQFNPTIVENEFVVTIKYFITALGQDDILSVSI